MNEPALQPRRPHHKRHHHDAWRLVAATPGVTAFTRQQSQVVRNPAKGIWVGALTIVAALYALPAAYFVLLPSPSEDPAAAKPTIAKTAISSQSTSAGTSAATQAIPVAGEPGFVLSRPENGPEFDLAAWVKSVAGIDHATWNRHHPGPYNGWFNGKSDDCAKKYILTWGPLGIRTRMHDHTWGTHPAFRTLWPPGLLDTHGDLLFDCFEVIDVIPGSPADGHLRGGDLLIAMDGQRFVTAEALHPDRPLLQHQGSRSLAMDAGERLDLAEGRGRISFDVIRPADGGPLSAPKELPARMTHEAQVTGEMRLDALTEVELAAKVAPGEELSVRFELTRKHNGSCAANVIRPRLEGPAGTLDLSGTRRLSSTTGWGKIRHGTDNDLKEITYRGQAVPASLWIHAPGHLTWVVPPGYDRFRAAVVCTRPAEGYRVRVVTRSVPDELPSHLKPLHTTVAFDIPKLGSYGPQAPATQDAKSALVARMTAAWLAGQQQADGSWKRTCGYTHNGYDTAWAGLGLMAQNDPAYDAHIRRAAEYIAFRCPQDGWAIPAAMEMIFLSEYWLRTHDDRILVVLQSQADRIRDEMVYGDWNTGHGRTPGYRGGGVSTGGAHVALAFAVANLTPVKAEPNLVDRMLARAQELAPSGFVPYGRSSGVRSFEPDLDSGCTYSGRHGPYLIASLIHGGPRLFTENCSAMYSSKRTAK